MVHDCKKCHCCLACGQGTSGCTRNLSETMIVSICVRSRPVPDAHALSWLLVVSQRSLEDHLSSLSEAVGSVRERMPWLGILAPIRPRALRTCCCGHCCCARVAKLGGWRQRQHCSKVNTESTTATKTPFMIPD